MYVMYVSLSLSLSIYIYIYIYIYSHMCANMEQHGRRATRNRNKPTKLRHERGQQQTSTKHAVEK